MILSWDIVITSVVTPPLNKLKDVHYLTEVFSALFSCTSMLLLLSRIPINGLSDIANFVLTDLTVLSFPLCPLCRYASDKCLLLLLLLACQFAHGRFLGVWGKSNYGPVTIVARSCKTALRDKNNIW